MAPDGTGRYRVILGVRASVTEEVLLYNNDLHYNIQHTFTVQDTGENVDTYMTVKGQIVIPSRIRRKLGMQQGTRIQVELDEPGQRIILVPITREYIQGLRGKYRGKGLLKALAAEKKRERDI